MEFRPFEAGKAVILSFRPKQWIKNLLLLLVPFFARDWDYKLIPAVAIFCALSGMIYLVNDIFDLESDRRHLIKRLRPLAAGTISFEQANTVLGLLILPVAFIAFILNKDFFLICLGYSILTFFYSLKLKKVLIIDSMAVATGFVLRVLAGAVIVEANITHWFILTIFSAAFFIISAKRFNSSQTIWSRDLAGFAMKFSMTFFILCYTIYLSSHEVLIKFGSNKLLLTVPVIIYALFRFLHNVYKISPEDDPTEIFWKDKTLQISALIYILLAGVLIYM